MIVYDVLMSTTVNYVFIKHELASAMCLFYLFLILHYFPDLTTLQLMSVSHLQGTVLMYKVSTQNSVNFKKFFFLLLFIFE